MICPKCGFHNQPGDERCGSCGEPLPAAAPGNDPPAPGDDPPAQAPDPHGATRAMPAVGEECWNCGTLNEPSRTFCQACGQQLRSAGTQPWPAAPPVVGHATNVRPSDPRGRRPWLLALAILAALVLAAAALALAGFPGGGSDAPAAAPASPPAEGAAGTVADAARNQASPTPGAASGARFRCEAQTVTAAEPGRWIVHRAHWGRRSGFDYIRFALRRGSGSDEAAAVTSELVVPDQVRARHGVAPPEQGDVALVLAFDGPVGLTGSFGRNVNQRALRQFRLARGEDGMVRAVLGLAGPGCYDLSADGWQSGARGNAEVRIEVAAE